LPDIGARRCFAKFVDGALPTRAGRNERTGTGILLARGISSSTLQRGSTTYQHENFDQDDGGEGELGSPSSPSSALLRALTAFT